jgi:hypothetical protein
MMLTCFFPEGAFGEPSQEASPLTAAAFTGTDRTNELTEALNSGQNGFMRNFTRYSLPFLLFVLLLEFLLFRSFVIRELIPAYPPNFDQTFYLSRAYTVHEALLNHDLQLMGTKLKELPQGFFVPLQAAVFFLFTHASRLNALSLNFLYFALLQLAIFLTLKSITGRLSVSFLAVGLLLPVRYWLGGMSDFRLDHISFCLFTLFLTAVIRSGIFYSRKWTILSSAIAAGLVLSRFLSFVYIVGILAGFSVVSFFLASLKGLDRSELKIRIKNAALFSVLLSGVTLPLLWTFRRVIYNYYIIGHLIGKEKEIRAAEQGLTFWADHLLYYPRSLLSDLYGWHAIILGVAVLLCLFLMLRRCRSTASPPSLPYREIYLFLIISAIVPLSILTLDVSKSPVAGGILIGPVFWLIVVTAFRMLPEGREIRGLANKVTSIVAAAVFLFGMGSYMLTTSKHLYDDKDKIEREKVVTMYQEIGAYCERHGITRPVLSFDRVTDYFVSYLFDVIHYERTGHYVEAQGALGGSIFFPGKETAMDLIRKSDVVFLGAGMDDRAETSPYPFDREMARIKPDLRLYLEKERVKLKSYSLFGKGTDIFVKPTEKKTGVDE